MRTPQHVSLAYRQQAPSHDQYRAGCIAQSQTTPSRKSSACSLRRPARLWSSCPSPGAHGHPSDGSVLRAQLHFCTPCFAAHITGSLAYSSAQPIVHGCQCSPFAVVHIRLRLGDTTHTTSADLRAQAPLRALVLRAGASTRRVCGRARSVCRSAPTARAAHE